MLLVQWLADHAQATMVDGSLLGLQLGRAQRPPFRRNQDRGGVNGR